MPMSFDPEDAVDTSLVLAERTHENVMINDFQFSRNSKSPNKQIQFERFPLLIRDALDSSIDELEQHLSNPDDPFDNPPFTATPVHRMSVMHGISILTDKSQWVAYTRNRIRIRKKDNPTMLEIWERRGSVKVPYPWTNAEMTRVEYERGFSILMTDTDKERFKQIARALPFPRSDVMALILCFTFATCERWTPPVSRLIFAEQANAFLQWLDDQSGRAGRSQRRNGV